MSATDVILIMELKFDNGSTKAVDELQAIETLAKVMEEYPEMEGHWYAITFFAPLAEKMKELMPEIPLGFLGAGQSGKETDEGLSAWGGGWTPMTSIDRKIAFLRKYNAVLDETYDTSTDDTAQAYLARGYTQNTWTFQDITHFSSAANIATTDTAENCAMLVKEIISPGSISEAELSSGVVPTECIAYNGWRSMQDCEIILFGREGNTVQILLYYVQKDEDGTPLYGLYGELMELTVV